MKNSLIFIVGGIIVVLLVILFVFGSGGMSKQKAGVFTIDFITNELASPGTEFTLVDVKEANGMYEVNFEVMGQEDTAYVTKNGKYLFFQPIDMKPAEPTGFTKTDKPEVDLFVMSYCPYGNQAEELLMPVAQLLGDSVDVELHYIVYSDYATGYPDYCIDEDNVYCSMHKIAELNQGIRELCVAKYQPDKFWDFVIGANTATSDDIEQKWQGIASGIGIDVNQISTCQKDEGMALLDNELALSNALYPVQEPAQHNGREEASVSGSPTLIINGMIYDGGRSADAYKEAICSAMTNPVPECEQSITSDAAADGSCE